MNQAQPPRLVSPLLVRVILATFAYFVALGAMLPTIPLYVKGPLGRGEVGIGVSLAAFAFAAVILRPWAGRVGDVRGRRLVMVGGAGALAASIAAYSVADTLPVLVALRAVTGAGEAFFFVGAAAVVNDIAPDARRGEAMSYFSLGLHGGLAVGPALGETVLGRWGYDTVWFAAAAAAAIGAILCTTVSETRPPGAEHHEPQRLINPAGVLPGAILALLLWGLISYLTFLPLYARELGMSGSASAFGLYSGIVLLIRSAGAKLPDVLGFHRAAVASLTAASAGLIVVAAFPSPAGLFAGTALCAVGHGLSFPALISMAVTSALPAERASVVGTVGMFFDAAVGIGALTAGATASAFGYRGAFAVASAGGVAGLLLLARHRMRSAQPVHS